MATLSTYLTQTRRLLHDANARYWSDAELTDHINDARLKTVMDTGCLRALQSFTLTAGTEVYAFTALPTQPVLDILNITVIWGSTRYPLQYLAFTDLSAALRPWTNYQQIPAAFSVYGQGNFYLGPVPDQNYVCEIDTVVAPATLVNPADVDQIAYPFTEPVPYWAARQAKMSQQSWEEADKLEQLYNQRVQQILNGVYTRRVRSAYGTT